MKYAQLAILGRQSKLALAELESIRGSENVMPFGENAALLVQPYNDGKRLGGVTRLARPLEEIANTNWGHIARKLEQCLASELAKKPLEGKIKLGLSVFGVNVGQRELFATGLSLKKAARSAGRSVRVIPNTALELNSAQVLNNKLTDELGIELLIVKGTSNVWLACTTWTQDIDDYAKRDFGRPKRDAFVGMLPPKLAQTMLNLANVKPTEVVLDPFCGTGVVLQEARLLGASAIGTDISEKMVDYSKQNMDWLIQAYNLSTNDITIETGDATTHHWSIGNKLAHVVCETYLGQPLSGLPSPAKLAEIMQNCDTIITKFLKNLHPQLTKDTRCTIAVPAWRVGSQFKHLKLIDHLEDLGYNRVRFTHANWQDLIYHREDQIVARELLVLITK